MNRRLLASALARLGAALLALALLGAPLAAGEREDRVALDQLFAQLRVAPDAQTASAIDQRIWTIWTSPSDPVLAARMEEALAARRIGDLDAAIALLTSLIEDYPAYAEAWNQRATMYFLLENYEASLADIEQVLVHEPRHFGALSGRALIYLRLGNRPLALRSMAAALAVHPFLSERGLFPELFEDATRI